MLKLKTIPMELLDPDSDQPRRKMEPEPLADLAGSIETSGLLQPVICYPLKGRFVIADGHRRFEAHKLLKRETISALVLDGPPTKTERRRIQLAANCHRVGLTPLEKARAYQELKIENGYSNTQLAHFLNVSKAMVTQVLSYLTLPDEAQRFLDSGELSGSAAYAIARAGDRQAQLGLLEQARNGRLTRAQVNGVRRRGQRTHRSTFLLGSARLALAMPDSPALPEIIEACKQLIRECRKATRDGLDVSTLERVLADRHRATESTAADGTEA